MKSFELENQLNEIRQDAISVIKSVMMGAGVTRIDLDNYAPITHNDDEIYTLSAVELTDDDTLHFESDSDIDTIYDTVNDLYTDVLVAIAQWMEENKESINKLY